MSQFRRRAGLVAAAAFLAAGPALAQPAPLAGEPVLVLTGKVAESNSSGVLFDMAALERLPQHSFSTNTPWTRAPQKFTGPLLRDVLRLAGARGTVLKAAALNDYKVTIPVEDAQREDVIVALRIDGKPIPVRERGPLFVIYPFDSKPQLQTQRYYERSIWQLKSILVE